MIAPGGPPHPDAFDANSPKYRCCCSKCHVTDGAKKIAYFEIGMEVLNLIGCVVSLSFGGILPLVLMIAITILLLVGLSKQSHNWLVPHLVMQVILIIFMLIMVVIMIGVMIGASSLSQYMEDSDSYEGMTKDEIQSAILMMGVVGLVSCLLTAGLQCWFIVVVFRCYQYLKERAHQPFARNNMQPQSIVVMQHQPGRPIYSNYEQPQQPPMTANNMYPDLPNKQIPAGGPPAYDQIPPTTPMPIMKK